MLQTENFMELKEYLQRLLSGTKLTAKDILDLHSQSEAAFRQAVNAAILDGHPGWCVCGGQRAAKLYLARNWLRGGSRKDEISRLRVLTEQMERDFVSSERAAFSAEYVEKLLRQLDEQDQFTAKVMGEGQLLILFAGCKHRQFSALCRPFIYHNNSFGCDIYLFQPQEDDTASPESILLHELGHILNLRLTGDVSVVPEDFLTFGEYFFPGLSTEHRASAPEFFAHCFAMGVISRPGLEQYDAFPTIRMEHKRLFDAYMRAKIAML